MEGGFGMDYEYLHKIFNKSSNEEYTKAKKERIEGYGAIRLDFEIKTYGYTEKFKLFFYNHPRMMKNAEKIMSNSEEIKKIARVLPGIAKEAYQINTLVEEMQGTNEIEGVRSSKAEMREGLRKIIDDNAEPLRHKSLIKSYLRLQQKKIKLLSTPEDVREIYDFLVLDEIKADDLPDGELFRLEPSELTRSNTGKIVHKNTMSEDVLKKELQKLIDFLNNYELSALHKIAIGHFLFGYLHPFYDGNGRTGRYISSIYLRNLLNPITALSLSKACKDNLKIYLDSFANTNNFKSSGDLTYFIDSFFEIINLEQEAILADLKEKREYLKNIGQSLKNNTMFDEKEESVLFILFQEYIYGQFSEGVSKKDILKYASKISSNYRFNKVKESLCEKGAIKVIKKNPIVITINPNFFGF
ncbi:Fic family protein [Listeria innocua]|nr:Fic family protein [Listeria monocytogenes]EAF5666944.1 Fic family protein [Listeria innocua]EAG3566532.1 Fic family protein [Listeria monocytogenes]EAG9435277.1 Fic family protein [Listeria innocua]MBM5709520.1 Fic family protein [Listeria innocua]